MNMDKDNSNPAPPIPPRVPPVIAQAPVWTPPPRKPFPGFWQAVGLLGIAFATIMIVSFPIGLADGLLNMQFSRNPWLLGIINAVGIGVACGIGLVLARATFREVYPLHFSGWMLLVPMLVLSVGAHILLSEVDNVMRRAIPPAEWMQELFEGLLGPSSSFFGGLFLLVIVAPLTEEFLFRGLILRGFLARYSAGTAIVGSALLFGAFHLNLPQAVAATGLGIIYGWWYWKTRSLIPCIFGHAVNNGLSFVASRSTALEIPGYTMPVIDGVQQFQPWWFNLTGLGLTVAGALWLYLALARRERVTLSSQQPFSQ
jgi:membrane protease YdiL (CAAX protease family)